MNKKRFLFILAAVIAAFSFVGCYADSYTEQSELTNSDVQQTATVTEQVTDIVETEDESSIETTTSLEEESEDDPFVTEFKITECKFEDFTGDVEINGKRFSLPCSYEELSRNFGDMGEFSWYQEDKEKYCHLFGVYYDDANSNLETVYLSDSIEENTSQADEMRMFYVLSHNTDSCSFRFGTINNYSDMTQEDVKKILGEPNMDLSFLDESEALGFWYVFDDYNVLSMIYDENGNVNGIFWGWGVDVFE